MPFQRAKRLAGIGIPDPPSIIPTGSDDEAATCALWGIGAEGGGGDLFAVSFQCLGVLTGIGTPHPGGAVTTAGDDGQAIRAKGC
jgi:hypothetical protein